MKHENIQSAMCFIQHGISQVVRLTVTCSSINRFIYTIFVVVQISAVLADDEVMLTIKPGQVSITIIFCICVMLT